MRQEIEASRPLGRFAAAYSVEVIGMVTGDTEEFCKAVDTTDDELAAIAAGTGLHVVK